MRFGIGHHGSHRAGEGGAEADAREEHHDQKAAKRRKQLFGGTPMKCKVAEISRCSRNCLPTIFSTIRRSRGARRTRLARASFYKVLRAAFPDFHADIHWQLVDGDRVTTYKTYHGTHKGEFFGMAPTGRKIKFETVDVMRVRDGKITEHWGVANLFSLMQQLGAFPVTPKV
jgi:predicted ester cyclase